MQFVVAVLLIVSSCFAIISTLQRNYLPKAAAGLPTNFEIFCFIHVAQPKGEAAANP